MSCETCKGHTDLTEETKAIKRASEITQVYDRQNRRLWIAIIVLAASMIVMAGCMVWQSMNQQKAVTEAIQRSQDTFNEAMLEALYAVADMEVTSETTTVNQDTGEGGGNAVYQAGEYATYDEGGAE